VKERQQEKKIFTLKVFEMMPHGTLKFQIVFWTFGPISTKDATIKDFKLEILICFNALITKHWTPLHQTPHIFPILLSKWTIFVMLQMLGGRLQMLFQF
jgi:hypothetical protein